MKEHIKISHLKTKTITASTFQKRFFVRVVHHLSSMLSSVSPPPPPPLRVSWQMGASDSRWCLGARPVWRWTEDCSAGRAWRWILHHLGGTFSHIHMLRLRLNSEVSQETERCHNKLLVSVFPCSSVVHCYWLCYQFHNWMVPSNSLEVVDPLVTYFQLWIFEPLPFVIHIYCTCPLVVKMLPHRNVCVIQSWND